MYVPWLEEQDFEGHSHADISSGGPEHLMECGCSSQAMTTIGFTTRQARYVTQDALACYA